MDTALRQPTADPMLFLSAEGGPTTVPLTPSAISATPAATGQMQRPRHVRIGGPSYWFR